MLDKFFKKGVFFETGIITIYVALLAACVFTILALPATLVWAIVKLVKHVAGAC